MTLQPGQEVHVIYYVHGVRRLVFVPRRVLVRARASLVALWPRLLPDTCVLVIDFNALTADQRCEHARARLPRRVVELHAPARARRCTHKPTASAA